MRWVSYLGSSGPRIGLVENGTIQALDGPRELLALLGDDGQKLRDAADAARRSPAEVVALTDVRLQAPIPRPPSIRDSLCFLEHLRGCRRAMGAPEELPPVWDTVPAFYFGNPAGVLGPFIVPLTAGRTVSGGGRRECAESLPVCG
jgi:hypothetical protein